MSGFINLASRIIAYSSSLLVLLHISIVFILVAEVTLALCSSVDTVIMQAIKTTPVDLTCKDKFLVQSTIVPEGTLEEHMTSEMVSLSC